jgi:phosphoribosylformylglycinamidine cyclo-ligase
VDFGVDDDEMHRVFNMGVGLALVVSDYYAESIQQQLGAQGFETWRIGQIVEGRGEVRWS